MARKVIGPTGSRRRRWLFLLCLVSAITAGVISIPGALAVHDAGVFQLDGNATVADNSIPAMPFAAEDADSICAKFAATATDPSGNPLNPAGLTCNQPGATTLPGSTASPRTGFVTDGSGLFASGSNDDQWTGGSKDDQAIGDWKYKQAASSNDKSDIENAFAAVYTPTSGAESGHRIIYFGGDRVSNSGSENTAFWFLQHTVSENPNTSSGCTLNSGCGFTGGHVAANPGADGCLTQGSLSIQMVTVGSVKAGTSPCTETDLTPDTGGDVLVVSAFTVGGTQPNTTAYEWVGVGHAPKAFCVTSKCSVIQISTVEPGCDPNVTNDPVCAITNQNIQYSTCPTGAPLPQCVAGNAEPIASPWIYAEKSSDTSTSGANTCTVASNHMCPGTYFEGGLDLTALGLGGECTSSFTMDTRSSASVDSSLQDLAVGQLGSCETSLTTKAGDTEASGGVASPTKIGGGSVNSGTDTATLTVQGSSSWSGTLSWFICGPFPSTPSTTPKCDKNKGVPAGSMGVSGTNDSPHTYVSPSASSVSLTSAGTYCWTAHFESSTTGVPPADDTGAYECFTVEPATPTLTTCSGTYSGTGSPAACVPATDVALGNPIYDRARLSGLATEPGDNGGRTSSPSGTTDPCTAASPCYPTINADNGAYAGSIKFTLNGPADTGCGSQTSNSATGDQNPQSVSVDSAVGNKVYGPVSYTPAGGDAPGTYHWQATIDYLNGSGVEQSVNNDLPQSEDNATCADTNEDVTVLQHPTSTQTTPVDGSGNPITTVLKGTSVYDQAIVTNTDSGGGSPTGTVDFYICDPNQTTGASDSEKYCAGTGSVPPSGTGSGTLVDSGLSLSPGPGSNQSEVTSQTPVVVNQTGVWCFRADYNPDTGAFAGSSDNTHDECFKVVDVTMSTAQTFTLTDSATITPQGPGATIGGTVVFSLYDNDTCSGAHVFQESVDVPDQSTAYEADATTSYSAKSDKTLSWLVVYTPDLTATDKTVTESCNTENASVTIDNGSG